MTAPGTFETKLVLSRAEDRSVTNGFMLDAREVSSTEKEGQCAKVRTLLQKLTTVWVPKAFLGTYTYSIGGFWISTEHHISMEHLKGKVPKILLTRVTSVGVANPKQKPTILLCGFESNTLLSKLDCAWDLKGSHTIVCKTFSHTGDHTILSLSPKYFPSLICFWNRQITPSIGGKKEKSSLNGQ